jgi:hypothetical protein
MLSVWHGFDNVGVVYRRPFLSILGWHVVFEFSFAL